MSSIDLSLGLEEAHFLVTGAAGHIGSRVVLAFLQAGCRVSALDIGLDKLEHLKTEWANIRSPSQTSNHLHIQSADITSDAGMRSAMRQIKAALGSIHCCIALASLDLSVLKHHQSIIDMPVEQFRATMNVNVTGTFLTAKYWLKQLVETADAANLRNKSLIIVGSESGTFGERSNPDYAASKSAVQGGLLQSLKAEVPRTVPGTRVNAIAPGPVDTVRFRDECRENLDQKWIDSQATSALGEPVPVDAVAKSIVFLASENMSSHIHGQVLAVDSGKQGKLMWMQGEKP